MSDGNRNRGWGRDILAALGIAAIVLVAFAGLAVRRGPTLVVLAIGAVAWVWSRAPFVPEEAVARAKLRHRLVGLEGCPWLERVDEDESGALYRSRVGWPWWEEPIQMVEVCNYTPEPDGTFTRYVLRVPPSIATARAAVAWTFGLEEERYQPEDES